jgi:hypothetical protein
MSLPLRHRRRHMWLLSLRKRRSRWNLCPLPWKRRLRLRQFRRPPLQQLKKALRKPRPQPLKHRRRDRLVWRPVFARHWRGAFRYVRRWAHNRARLRYRTPPRRPDNPSLVQCRKLRVRFLQVRVLDKYFQARDSHFRRELRAAFVRRKRLVPEQ